jgi:hypothetical protein
MSSPVDPIIDPTVDPSSAIVTDSTVCRKCNTPGSGRFCTECGAPLIGAPCPSCQTVLSPGATFCHQCGSTANATANAGAAAQSPASTGSGLASTLPWAVAGIAFLTLFAMLAGKGLNARKGSTLDAPANALPNPALDGGGPMGTANATAPFTNGGSTQGAQGSMRAPDISNMNPAELADRLFNRVMLLDSQGKRDSVQFFAPMAIQAYSMLVDQQGHPLELDQRYDVGRIAEVAGALPLAKAQADTILQQAPDHLLGLLLAANVAKRSGNTPARQEYARRFNAAKERELAKKLPEYVRHRSDIDGGA